MNTIEELLTSFRSGVVNHHDLVDKIGDVPLRDEVKGLPGLSPRKLHEVSQLVPLILEYCKAYNVEFVIDIGSGKSYLSRALSAHINVICVEKDRNRVKSSKRLDLLSDSKVYYVDTIDNLSNCKQFVLSHKKTNNGIPNCLLVGLDVCFDLYHQVLISTYSNLDGLMNIKGILVVPCCPYKVKSLLTHQDVTPPYWLSRQDLRFLTSDEVKDMFQNDEESIDFSDWLLKKGHLSELWESIVLTDCIQYLRSKGWTNVELKRVFDFKISSRNIMVIAIHK